MNIEGSYTLQAGPEEIWSLLTNVEMIQQALPGVEQLERVEQDLYSLVMRISQAPLQGTYAGRVKITERQYPSYLCFVIEELGEQDSLSGIGGIYLQKQEQNTIVTYKGTLHISKQHGRVAPNVLKGATKLLIQQSFAQLSEKSRESSNGNDGERGHHKNGSTLVLPKLAAITTRKTLWPGIAHQLHLGSNDPVQEEIWGKRVRRAGSAAGLLLLIWVGTRLPRKK
jgi:carbon monoxide dehydrogenase subunit G